MLNSGLYIHIPFCQKKCAYCDFYSSFVSGALIDEYVGALSKEINRWGGLYSRPIDTIYIGGGTPSVLGTRISRVLDEVYNSFEVLKDAEITVEMNPSSADGGFLKSAYNSGVNRLSLGVQSGIDEELKILGRNHTAQDALRTVDRAKTIGFSNISLDVMLGLPESNIEKLEKSLDFVLSLEPSHISSYILKIEPNTVFGKKNIVLPDDDQQAEQYLYMCDRLETSGFEHYEISNFARKGFYSRHNMKYWRCEDYLGIGPSAHSFLDGARFYYPRDLKGFLSNPQTVSDGNGGDEAEKIMLALRLKEGADLSKHKMVQPFLSQLEIQGLGNLENGRFSLTNRGMLVSNSIITEILEKII